jgi:hypothetical protein
MSFVKAVQIFDNGAVPTLTLCSTHAHATFSHAAYEFKTTCQFLIAAGHPIF